MCPVFKKGDKTECSNYRGISLMSHAFKVYERILEKRLRGHVEPKLGEWQSGFRLRRGTADSPSKLFLKKVGNEMRINILLF